MDASSEIKLLQNLLREKGDPQRAVQEKKYLKHSLTHYGVTVPALRKIAKQWAQRHPDIAVDELDNICQQLWHSNWHEERSLTLYIYGQYLSKLDHGHLPIFEDMANQVTTWAHLDELAVNIVGSILETDASALLHLPVWAESNNFWVRRMSLIAQLRAFRRGEGDFDLFTDIAIPQLKLDKSQTEEERFFIAKAVGWALRELSKSDPEKVVNFVRENYDGMPKLTFREATRKLLPKHQRLLEVESDG